jgi:peptidoglycan/LPS O-acetylase OafA/YrhL
LAGIGVLTAPVLRALLFWRWPAHWLGTLVLMPCRADALLLGVLAAILRRDPKWSGALASARGPFGAAVFGLLAGVVYLNQYAHEPSDPLMLTFGYSWVALFYVSLLLTALTWPQAILARLLRSPWLRSLGTVAYGAYLFQLGALHAVTGILPASPLGRSPVMAALIALGVTLALAALSWRYFEQPFVRWGHRSAYRLPAEEPAHTGLVRSGGA